MPTAPADGNTLPPSLVARLAMEETLVRPTPRSRPTTLAAIAWAVAVILAGCEGPGADDTTAAAPASTPDPTAEPTPEPTPEPTVDPATPPEAPAVAPASAQGPPAPETPIAERAGEILTFADIDRAIRQRAMLRGVPLDHLVPDGWQRDPAFLVRVADTIYQGRALRAAAERLGATPDAAALEDAWVAHESLRLYRRDTPEATAALLDDLFGLEVADLHELLVDEAAYAAWVRSAREAIDDEAARRDYLDRRTTIELDVVRVPNLPTDAELDAFVAAPPTPDLFERAYVAARARFATPATRSVLRLRCAGPADPARVRAALGAFAASHPSRPEYPPNLVDARGERVCETVLETVTDLTEAQAPEVFAAALDDATSVYEERGGALVVDWVTGHTPAQVAPLDDTVRRALAREHLARGAPLPSALARLERARELLRGGDEGALRSFLGAELLRLDHYGPLSRSEAGGVAGLGEAPGLEDALFALTPEAPILEAPFVVRGDLVTARLTARTDATDADYERDREAYAAELDAAVERSAWDAFWAAESAAAPVRLLPDDAFFGIPAHRPGSPETSPERPATP
jgi:hypothetical protein